MTATIVTSTSRTEPIAAVSHGPRSGERQNAGRNGPGRRATSAELLARSRRAAARRGERAPTAPPRRRRARRRGVDVAQRRQPRHESPSAASRARCTAPVCSSLIGTPSNTAAVGRGAGRSPSSRRRWPGRRPRRGPPARARPASSSAGVTCGVSMPTSSAGPSASSKAAASRSVEAVAALGDDLEPAGGPRRPGSPSKTRMRRPACRRGERGGRACRRAPRRPARPPARACRAGSAASWRGPGTGSLAMTRREGAMWRMRARRALRFTAARRTCRARCAPCPRSVPVIFERPSRAR